MWPLPIGVGRVERFDIAVRFGDGIITPCDERYMDVSKSKKSYLDYCELLFGGFGIFFGQM